MSLVHAPRIIVHVGTNVGVSAPMDIQSYAPDPTKAVIPVCDFPSGTLLVASMNFQAGWDLRGSNGVRIPSLHDVADTFLNSWYILSATRGACDLLFLPESTYVTFLEVSLYGTVGILALALLPTVLWIRISCSIRMKLHLGRRLKTLRRK